MTVCSKAGNSRAVALAIPLILVISTLVWGCSDDRLEEENISSRFYGISVSMPNDRQVIFQSHRPDTQVHLQEVLSGKHQQYVYTKDPRPYALNNQWYMVEFAKALMPTAKNAKVTYDLATAPGIKLSIRLYSTAWNDVLSHGDATKVDITKQLYGTFRCQSATPPVHGKLEISNQEVVSAIKQTSYPNGGKLGFALYLDYQGAYPYPDGINWHFNSQIGGLFNIAGSE